MYEALLGSRGREPGSQVAGQVRSQARELAKICSGFGSRTVEILQALNCRLPHHMLLPLKCLSPNPSANAADHFEDVLLP
jgi:hypothetical protein